MPDTAAGEAVVYWELRRSFEPGLADNVAVLLSGGPTARAEIDEGLLADFDSATTSATFEGFAHGYHWTSAVETGGFRRVGDAWELVVTKLVEFCDPVRTDRFLLEIRRDGTVTVLKQEEYESQDGVCI